jgi:hypothetical protein
MTSPDLGEVAQRFSDAVSPPLPDEFYLGRQGTSPSLSFLATNQDARGWLEARTGTRRVWRMEVVTRYGRHWVATEMELVPPVPSRLIAKGSEDA